MCKYRVPSRSTPIYACVYMKKLLVTNQPPEMSSVRLDRALSSADGVTATELGIYLHICCCVCITRSNVPVFGVCMTHCKDIKISTSCMCFRSLLASCCMRRPLWPRFRSENTLTIRRAYLHVTLKLAAGRESRWRHATLCLDADTCSHWYKPLSTLKWQWRSFLDGWVKRLRNTAVLAVCGEFIKVYTINPRNRFYGSKTTTKPDWMGLAEKWSE